jgi:hypothetical protein
MITLTDQSVVSAAEIAERTGYTQRHVNRILAELQLEVVEYREPENGGHRIPCYKWDQWEIAISHRSDLKQISGLGQGAQDVIEEAIQERIEELREKITEREKQLLALVDTVKRDNAALLLENIRLTSKLESTEALLAQAHKLYRGVMKIFADYSENARLHNVDIAETKAQQELKKLMG